MTPRSRRLTAAQLTTAAFLGFLGQFLVGSPQTYFGPPDRITTVGSAYVGALLTLLCVCLLGLLRGRSWARIVAPLVPTLNVAAFVQPIVAAPAVAGLLVLYNLALLGQLLLPAAPELLRWRPVSERDPLELWLAHNGPAARHLLWMSVLTSVTIVGFERADRLPVQIACGLLAAIALWAPLRWHLRERDRPPPWLWVTGALVALAAILGPFEPGGALLVAAAAESTMLAHLFSRSAGLADLQRAFYDHPALLILVSFVAVILVGTLLLSFPAASTQPGSIGVVDAAFTATSAVCVTGLIVLDTPHDFTGFGHAVILLLIQVGGLNIMVLSAFGALLVGRRLGLRGQRALGEVLEVETPASAYRLIGFIVASTFAFEAAGTLLLLPAYRDRGLELLQALWRAGFHSVSAFCNAGFALHSDSLVGFADRPLVLLTVAGLIVLGGIGFPVLAWASPWTRGRGIEGLRVHARIVLVTSGVLLAAGTAAYAIIEWNRSLGGLDPAGKLLHSVFQSVTLRTAGFSSVSFGELGAATSLWMMVFMFIGASPGGTGGGIKTTTLVVLFAAVPTVMSSRARAVIAGRTVSLASIHRSAAIATVTSLVLVAGAVLLLATQEGTFQSLLFEAFSAVGTVGLSLGATTTLDAFGKIVIMALMLLGRIGPLTLALLLGKRLAPRVEHPEARIIVG